jgi:hypothetical protein
MEILEEGEENDRYWKAVEGTLIVLFLSISLSRRILSRKLFADVGL